MSTRRLHGVIAVGLTLFLALHLGNHLAGVWGQDWHRAIQATLRIIYRSPLVEVVLLSAFAAQVVLGLLLVRRRRKLTIQVLSGLYLAGFLVIHIAAIMAARWQNIDTDLAFAAAGLHASAPWPLFFAPYYGLAVLAVFAHLSIPIGRRHQLAGHVMLGLGAAVSLTLVMLLSGLLTALTIPASLIASFP